MRHGERPKCFAEIRGKRILDWTVDALRAGGVTDVASSAATAWAFERDYPPSRSAAIATGENNNILVSLMCARMDRPFVTATRTSSSPGCGVRPRGVARTTSRSAWTPIGAPTTSRAPSTDRTIREGDHEDGRIVRVQREIPYETRRGIIGPANFRARGGELLREHYHRRRADVLGQPTGAWRSSRRLT